MTVGNDIGQHLVFIGSAEKHMNGQTHFFGVISRQNISEIPCGHNDIDGFAFGDFAVPAQSGIGFEIINDLREQTTPVNGVGRRKTVAFFIESGVELGIAENLFHAALTVIEIAV